MNHAPQTDVRGRGGARRRRARTRSTTDTPPVMGGEDFSFMLEARPGAFIFIGNGDTAGLHHPNYDFNDEAIPVGIILLGAPRRNRHAGLNRAATASTSHTSLA